jgi:hypothetical protein
MEREARPDEERSEKAAAEHGEEQQEPEQDETESTTFDTDEHSDAPGPFGTG